MHTKIVIYTLTSYIIRTCWRNYFTYYFSSSLPYGSHDWEKVGIKIQAKWKLSIPLKWLYFKYAFHWVINIVNTWFIFSSFPLCSDNYIIINHSNLPSPSSLTTWSDRAYAHCADQVPTLHLINKICATH